MLLNIADPPVDNPLVYICIFANRTGESLKSKCSVPLSLPQLITKEFYKVPSILSLPYVASFPISSWTGSCSEVSLSPEVMFGDILRKDLLCKASHLFALVIENHPVDVFAFCMNLNIQGQSFEKIFRALV